MDAVFPEIVLPDLVLVPATRTPMNDGIVAGGDELFPGDDDHGPPHGAGGVLVGRLTVPANPLKDAGAPPPDRLFSVAQL